MQNIRNVAIIAHVDHGKTTLVDRILYQSKLFRENQDIPDLILDSNDLERERGITILSKNVSVRYKEFKINIIDTPGHSDFGGEVERVLNMADGVLLIVDAFEGPMPQTRFVLQKAVELHLKPIVVVNKVDKPNCNPEQTQEDVFDLMFSLGASEEQLDFPTVFGSSKLGWMGPDWKTPTEDISYLLDQIIEHIPAHTYHEGNTQMIISSLDYSSYVGRIAVGKLHRGSLIWGQNVSLVKRDGRITTSKIKELYTFEGLGKEKTKNPVYPGEICAILGIADFEIGDTIADYENPEALPIINVDE
ncbi:MAG: GTP-binding protein, partial [Bacteroidales bacterium]|nr:GTP-binding protein [Bacteroidales bacterium]